MINQIIENLEEELISGSDKKVLEMLDGVDLSTLNQESVQSLLDLIRSKRKFDILEKVSLSLIAHGHVNTEVKLQLAQSLIEQNRFVPAESVLLKLNGSPSVSDLEKVEVKGRLARLYKQKYINLKSREDLDKALKYYGEGWEDKLGDYRWHGINLVALLKNDVELSGDNKVNVIATQLISEIENIENRNCWDCATAIEAALAKSDEERVLNWTKELINHDDIDAFTLGSILRQLREVWGIGTPLVNKIEPILEYEILQQEGGRVQITPDHISDFGGFEAIYGTSSATKIVWLDNLFSKLASVARVCNRNTGDAVGTGFVVIGSSISNVWNDSLVFITNSHVVNDLDNDRDALTPDMAVAEFTRVEGRPSLKLGKKLFHSPKEILDVWICEIENSEILSSIELTKHKPILSDDGSDPQRVYVIGHPRGGDLSITLDNNELVGYESPFVHYKCPTEAGSSGSPVLSRALQAFALHHRAREDIQANQGVLFNNILQEIEDNID